MGVTPSVPSSPLAHFIKCHYHASNLQIIQHHKTGQLLICQQLVPQNQTHASHIQSMLKNKLSLKSSFVTELVYWQQIHQASSCDGITPHFLALFNNIGVTLEQFSHPLRPTTCKFNYQSISCILKAVLKGLKYFKQVNHFHESIDQNCIFYDGKRTILVDPWLKPYFTPPKNFPYKSPQKQLFERDQIASYDKFKSLLYELGLLLLDLASDCGYSRAQSEREERNVGKVKIGSILENITDFKLRSKLSILLNPNPQKRLIIYNIVLPDKVTLRQFNTTQKFTYSLITPISSPQRHRIKTEHTNLSKKKNEKSSKKQEPSEVNLSQKIKNIKYLSSLSSPASHQITKRTGILSSSFYFDRNQSPKSSFTYAQMLKTPTQTNSNYWESKKSSPLGIQKKNTGSSNWHLPHKIISQDLNAKMKFKTQVREKPTHKKIRIQGVRKQKEIDCQMQKIKERSRSLEIKQWVRMPTIFSVSNLHEVGSASQKYSLNKDNFQKSGAKLTNFGLKQTVFVNSSEQGPQARFGFRSQRLDNFQLPLKGQTQADNTFQAQNILVYQTDANLDELKKKTKTIQSMEQQQQVSYIKVKDSGISRISKDTLQTYQNRYNDYNYTITSNQDGGRILESQLHFKQAESIIVGIHELEKRTYTTQQEFLKRNGQNFEQSPPLQTRFNRFNRFQCFINPNQKETNSEESRSKKIGELSHNAVCFSSEPEIGYATPNFKTGNFLGVPSKTNSEDIQSQTGRKLKELRFLNDKDSLQELICPAIRNHIYHGSISLSRNQPLAD